MGPQYCLATSPNRGVTADVQCRRRLSGLSPPRGSRALSSGRVAGSARQRRRPPPCTAAHSGRHGARATAEPRRALPRARGPISSGPASRLLFRERQAGRTVTWPRGSGEPSSAGGKNART
ncbi:hypothetical protein HPB50_021089 [Hyalomma asiaticum]|uniref:Uncharacterized protein n=1 Tax=Hyalomma asiaticum TaxID=266040 RepID=A0ACB7TKP2_HYAAI|nr:hypothetical protein HPB50_021089 [Hyalomma asiaticum]